MNRLAILLSAVLLSACAGLGASGFTQANHEAVDALVAAPSVPIEKDVPLLVATVVNVDSMHHTSRFGRLVAEQVAARLAQHGYHVVEMKMRSDIYIREGTGELLLSRDVRDLVLNNYRAQVVVVGNYAVSRDTVYLTLKAVTVADNRVIAAVNYQLPLTEGNAVLLSPPKAAARRE
jgi:TolB-like protein